MGYILKGYMTFPIVVEIYGRLNMRLLLKLSYILYDKLS